MPSPLEAESGLDRSAPQPCSAHSVLCLTDPDWLSCPSPCFRVFLQPWPPELRWHLLWTHPSQRLLWGLLESSGRLWERAGPLPRAQAGHTEGFGQVLPMVCGVQRPREAGSPLPPGHSGSQSGWDHRPFHSEPVVWGPCDITVFLCRSGERGPWVVRKK